MDIRVILLNTQEEENIGAVARAMKNFGLKELYLVNPCNIDKRARALASHGLDILQSATAVQDFQSAIRGCNYVIGTTGKKGGQKTPKRRAVTPEQLREMALKGKIALVFGNEASGIPNELLGTMDFVVRIPASPAYPILNLAQSVCVILYELSKKGFEKTVKERPITREVRASLDRYTKEIVDKVYAQPHQKWSTQEILTTIYGKAMLSKKEGGKMISFYRKILAKL